MLAELVSDPVRAAVVAERLTALEAARLSTITLRMAAIGEDHKGLLRRVGTRAGGRA